MGGIQEGFLDPSFQGSGERGRGREEGSWRKQNLSGRRRM